MKLVKIDEGIIRIEYIDIYIDEPNFFVIKVGTISKYAEVDDVYPDRNRFGAGKVLSIWLTANERTIKKNGNTSSATGIRIDTDRRLEGYEFHFSGSRYTYTIVGHKTPNLIKANIYYTDLSGLEAA